MDTILYNGVIRTLDRAYPQVSAMAVKNGVIVRLGGDEALLALREPQTHLIDLEGKLVLPGFSDSHLHLLSYAVSRRQIPLAQTCSYAETADLCRAAAERAREEGRWVIGSNFNEGHWSDTRKMPDRHDLDAIAADVPIYLQRACSHIACLNTRALQLAGLWDERADTTRETMDFGQDGLPNGYVRENTVVRVRSGWQQYSVSELKDLLTDACREAVSKGIVQVHSDDFNVIADGAFESVLQAYRELGEEGRLPIRVNEQVRFRTAEQLQRFLDRGYQPNQTFGRFKLGPVKFLCDGSLGSHSAALRRPYRNDPETSGILLFTDEELYALAELAYTHGFHLVAHCIGDAALEQMLNTLERLCRALSYPDRRNGIIHCQIMDERQQERFREMNLTAYIQPIFIKEDAKIADACVGEELCRQSYHWRRYADLGVHMCGGSDCPVEPMDVLPNLYCAVTRKGGPDAAPWYPENGVTLEEAVAMFTYEGAYASYDEARHGTLTVGKWADLAVLDRDIFSLPPQALLETQVLMTMVEGEIVYRR